MLNILVLKIANFILSFDKMTNKVKHCEPITAMTLILEVGRIMDSSSTYITNQCRH